MRTTVPCRALERRGRAHVFSHPPPSYFIRMLYEGRGETIARGAVARRAVVLLSRICCSCGRHRSRGRVDARPSTAHERRLQRPWRRGIQAAPHGAVAEPQSSAAARAHYTQRPARWRSLGGVIFPGYSPHPTQWRTVATTFLRPGRDVLVIVAAVYSL